MDKNKAVDLGEKIKELRKDKRIDIRELGRRTDVMGMHILNIEKGKTNASPELPTKIADALEANPDELLHLANRVDSEVEDVIPKYPMAVLSFLTSAKDLTPEGWDKTQSYLNRMKSQKAPKSNKRGN